MSDTEQQQEGQAPEVDAALEAGADEAAGDNTDFTPKVQVSEVEVKTLEEDEVVVYKQRCKVFLFVSKDEYGGEVRENYWKERGTGDVKLLKHKEAGKIRLLMRQEKTLKICLNHLVSPHVELKPNVGSDRSWVFSAADYADEEVKTDTFAIKFGSVENANAFKACIEKSKQINEEKMSPDELPALTEDDDKPAEKPAAVAEQSKEDAGTEALTEGMSKVALVGGFSAAEVTDDDVKAAAEFAAKTLEKGELVSVAEAAKQVVAGLNFRILLHIKHEDDSLNAYMVKVFKSLPHEGDEHKLIEHTHHGVVA